MEHVRWCSNGQAAAIPNSTVNCPLIFGEADVTELEGQLEGSHGG